MFDLAPAARRVAVLARGVGEEQLGAPTPCPRYAVRNLLGHLIGLSTAFRDAARKDFGASTGTNPGSLLPDVEPGWRGELETALDEVVEAWRDPAAWEGMTQAGSVDLPAGVAAVVVLNELTVHGWDLARATGQPYEADAADLERSHAMLAAFTERPDGAPFGPTVAVPDGAPLLDRVIGLSGRDPHWTAAG